MASSKLIEFNRKSLLLTDDGNGSEVNLIDFSIGGTGILTTIVNAVSLKAFSSEIGAIYNQHKQII